MTRLSNEEIIAFTKQAFKPYRCVPEFHDFDNVFKVAIYTGEEDGDGEEIRMLTEPIAARRVSRPNDLERFLLAQRLRGEQEYRLKLNAWGGLPDQTDC